MTRLAQWYQRAHDYNVSKPRICPRQCGGASGARYEYVTSKLGQAIILRCQDCGSLEHVEVAPGLTSVLGAIPCEHQDHPVPDRVVHLPGDPGARGRQTAKRRRR